MKNSFYKWIFKWHLIGGIVLLPIILIISITGSIYLFKDKYEQKANDEMTIIPSSNEKVSFQEQYEAAKKNWEKVPESIVVPVSKNRATEFTSGMFSHKSSIYVNPHNGKIIGKVNLNETDMYKVRKLHGELLSGKVGGAIVELVASWMVVLLITGIFIFWPRESGWKGFFRVRWKESKRIIFRDLHAVMGFWFSFVLILILAGGLPWTNIFGKNYAWVQAKLDAGYPATWYGDNFESKQIGTAFTVDQMITKAKDLKLKGIITVKLPISEAGVFSVYNETTDFDKIKMIHFDQYSGKEIFVNNWSDVGFMMRARQWVMAFHQGQFGFWNWLLILVTAIGLAFLSIMAFLSYLFRKKNKAWNEPKLTGNGFGYYGVISIVCLLSILLPLFGLSVLLIFCGSAIVRVYKAS